MHKYFRIKWSQWCFVVSASNQIFKSHDKDMMHRIFLPAVYTYLFTPPPPKQLLNAPFPTLVLFGTYVITQMTSCYSFYLSLGVSDCKGVVTHGVCFRSVSCKSELNNFLEHQVALWILHGTVSPRHTFCRHISQHTW